MNYITNKNHHVRKNHEGLNFGHLQENSTSKNQTSISVKPLTSADTSRKFGSKTTYSTTNQNKQVIFAITHGRGHANSEIGIAVLDVNSPKLHLIQLSDDIWYNNILTKINIYTPVEILLPIQTKSNVDSNLLDKIHKYFPKITITEIARQYFNDKDGLELIRRYCGKKYKSVIDGVRKKYYCLCAASALLQCICHYGIIIAENSIKVQYESKESSLMIDFQTAHRLELLYPLCRTRSKQSSLLGCLDNCVTIIGKRSLRASILEPSCDIEYIEKMHNVIDQFLNRIDKLALLEHVLSQFAKVDRLLKLALVESPSNIIQASTNMVDLSIYFIKILKNIPELLSIIIDLCGVEINAYIEILQNSKFTTITNEISRVLNIDNQSYDFGATQYFQRLYVIRPKVNCELDVYRDKYKDLVANINEIIKHLQISSNLPLTIGHSTTKGFYVHLSMKKNQQVPSLLNGFKILAKSKTGLHVTTEEIIKINFRINECMDEITRSTHRTISDLVMKLRQDMDVFYDLIGVISALDIIMSFTKVASDFGYCRPTFGVETRIVDAVHPLLEHTEIKQKTVPNGIIATPEYNFFIITGPNMGGKTIYLKTICVLQIMAQIGCYIPAKTAQFRLCDFLFARTSFGDNIELGHSSFVSEIHEIEYILKHVTMNGLIVIDELCRTTSSEEGLKIAWKICDKIVRIKGIDRYDEDTTMTSSKLKLKLYTSPFVYLTTHLHELTKLAEKYFSIVNLNFQADMVNINGEALINFTHIVQEGTVQINDYAILLARTIRFPTNFVETSNELIKTFKSKCPNQNINSITQPQPNKTVVIINRTINSVITHSNKSPRKSFNEDLLIVNRSFYNLYAELAGIYRNNNKPPSENEAYNLCLKTYFESQPNKFIKFVRKSRNVEMVSRTLINESLGVHDDHDVIVIEQNVNITNSLQIATTSNNRNSSLLLHKNINSVILIPTNSAAASSHLKKINNTDNSLSLADTSKNVTKFTNLSMHSIARRMHINMPLERRSNKTMDLSSNQFKTPHPRQDQNLKRKSQNCISSTTIETTELQPNKKQLFIKDITFDDIFSDYINEEALNLSKKQIIIRNDKTFRKEIIINKSNASRSLQQSGSYLNHANNPLINQINATITRDHIVNKSNAPQSVRQSDSTLNHSIHPMINQINATFTRDILNQRNAPQSVRQSDSTLNHAIHPMINQINTEFTNDKNKNKANVSQSVRHPATYFNHAVNLIDNCLVENRSSPIKNETGRLIPSKSVRQTIQEKSMLARSFEFNTTSNLQPSSSIIPKISITNNSLNTTSNLQPSTSKIYKRNSTINSLNSTVGYQKMPSSSNNNQNSFISNKTTTTKSGSHHQRKKKYGTFSVSNRISQNFNDQLQNQTHQTGSMSFTDQKSISHKNSSVPTEYSKEISNILPVNRVEVEKKKRLLDSKSEKLKKKLNTSIPGNKYRKVSFTEEPDSTCNTPTINSNLPFTQFRHGFSGIQNSENNGNQYGISRFVSSIQEKSLESQYPFSFNTSTICAQNNMLNHQLFKLPLPKTTTTTTIGESKYDDRTTLQNKTKFSNGGELSLRHSSLINAIPSRYESTNDQDTFQDTANVSSTFRNSSYRQYHFQTSEHNGYNLSESTKNTFSSIVDPIQLCSAKVDSFLTESPPLFDTYEDDESEIVPPPKTFL